MRFGVILLTVGLLVTSTPSASICEETLSPAEGGRIPLSNVAGKKIIRGEMCQLEPEDLFQLLFPVKKFKI